MVKMSASELDKVKSDTNKQKQNVDQVIQQINSAVTGTDWRSTAAASFKERWSRDRGVLSRLSSDLGQWANEAGKHADTARRLNVPFR